MTLNRCKRLFNTYGQVAEDTKTVSEKHNWIQARRSGAAAECVAGKPSLLGHLGFDASVASRQSRTQEDCRETIRAPSRRMTIWKPIPGFESYSVSESGLIRSNITGKVLKPFPRSKGYLSIDLSHDGRHCREYVHRLILLTFVGPCPQGFEACHGNDVNTDNRLDNLFWGTRQMNIGMRKHASGPSQSEAAKRGWQTRRLQAA